MRQEEVRTCGSARPRQPAAVLAALVSVIVVFAGLAWAEHAPDNAAASAKSPAAADDSTAATRDAISGAITSYGSDVQDAYHRELLKNPKIEGEITFMITIRPEGTVEDVRIGNSSLNWPPLEQEIVERIKAWKFQAFTGGPVEATVPYRFGPR